MYLFIGTTIGSINEVEVRKSMANLPLMMLNRQNGEFEHSAPFLLFLIAGTISALTTIACITCVIGRYLRLSLSRIENVDGGE